MIHVQTMQIQYTATEANNSEVIMKKTVLEMKSKKEQESS